MGACAGFVDPKTNNFPGSTLAYCSDGISIVIGSLMGTSPVTVFVGALPLSACAGCPDKYTQHETFAAGFVESYGQPLSSLVAAVGWNSCTPKHPVRAPVSSPLAHIQLEARLHAMLTLHSAEALLCCNHCVMTSCACAALCWSRAAVCWRRVGDWHP